MATTVTVDVKALAFSGRPDCVDYQASRVSLTLYPSEALRLVTDLLDRMDGTGIAAVYAHLRREEW